MKVDETKGIICNFQLVYGVYKYMGYIYILLYVLGTISIYFIHIHVLGPCFVWWIWGTISIPSEPFWTEQTCCPSRTVLLILLVTILGGTWALEQPSGSLLEFYPAFRHMLAAIFKWGGDCAVGVLDQQMFVLQNCWHIYIYNIYIYIHLWRE